MIRNSNYYPYILGAIIVFPSCLLIACDENKSFNDTPLSPTPEIGVFYDSVVEGLLYRTDSMSGLTDNLGKFKYQEEEIIKFYVGDILIGESQGKPVLTPMDLVKGATYSGNPAVVNITRFLQTIDDDGDAENGIDITPVIHTLANNKQVDFNQSIYAFESNGNLQTIISELTAARAIGAQNIVPVVQAQLHFKQTLLNLGIAEIIPEPSAITPSDPSQTPLFSPGEILVGFNDGVSLSNALSVINSQGLATDGETKSFDFIQALTVIVPVGQEQEWIDVFATKKNSKICRT